MTKTYIMHLPTALERVHGLYARRLIGRVHDVGLAALDQHLTLTLARRQDASETELENNDQGKMVLAAMAALGLSLSQIVNGAALRASLRQIANKNDAIVKQQIAIALGKAIRSPVPTSRSIAKEADAATPVIDKWIEAQADRIDKIVKDWFASLNTSVESATEFNAQKMFATLAEQKGKAQRQAFAAAATGLLLLNAELIAANALAAGANQYVWRTQLDENVRPHHMDLEGTIQSFDNPPPGGGTNDGDLGNPGDGINCRCIPELIVP